MVGRRNRRSRQSSFCEDPKIQIELIQKQIESQENILENVLQSMVIEIAQDSVKDEARKERM